MRKTDREDREKQKQFSLSVVMRVVIAIVAVAAVLTFATNVMRVNKLREEKKELEEKLAEVNREKERLTELLNADPDFEYIVRMAKQIGAYPPDSEIYYSNRKQ